MTSSINFKNLHILSSDTPNSAVSHSSRKDLVNLKIRLPQPEPPVLKNSNSQAKGVMTSLCNSVACYESLLNDDMRGTIAKHINA